MVYLFYHWEDLSTFFHGLAFHGNIDRLRAYILSFGYWAPLISALFMIGQSIILFLPAFPIFIVNTLVFGPYWGGILSWGSAVIGSILCFSISKTLGRPVVQRLVSRAHLEAAEVSIKKYEKYIILFFGFIPVISFDVISYASGLTILSIWEFIPLVCIAQIPSTLLYSILVHKIDRGLFDTYWIVAALLFLSITIASVIMRSRFKSSERKHPFPTQP